MDKLDIKKLTTHEIEALIRDLKIEVTDRQMAMADAEEKRVARAVSRIKREKLHKALMDVERTVPVTVKAKVRFLVCVDDNNKVTVDMETIQADYTLKGAARKANRATMEKLCERANAALARVREISKEEGIRYEVLARELLDLAEAEQP